MKKKKAKSKAKSKPARKAKAKVKKSVNVKKTKPVARRSAAQARKSKPKKTKASASSTPKPGVIAPVNGVLLGFVEDYFAKIGVIALTLKAPISVGQRIQVLGHTTRIEQVLNSMQIEHAMVDTAKSGDGVGIKVNDRARAGDHVYLMK